MRIQLLAVARELKRDPLADAAADYLTRAKGFAPALGLKGPDCRFLTPAKGNDPAREALLVREAIGQGGAVLLDERGEDLTSEEIAGHIAALRDRGVGQLSFCIGGADGFDEALRREIKASGGRLLRFGRCVWPHALCRTMLSEQLYRALAILAGHPYHRGP
ncbi:MAG: 23S rRNA (pseudouridine(1915)-N(3))-methyltransferase RlmH [Parvularcula sp.]|jgi:23S rRNA (pseudouridine1915-N3)-methyltransferase|nr:23S rRNA (pseudouridine(1915)-N(3))-methyltransferase RlmH [Parvularcula sp.]